MSDDPIRNMFLHSMEKNLSKRAIRRLVAQAQNAQTGHRRGFSWPFSFTTWNLGDADERMLCQTEKQVHDLVNSDYARNARQFSDKHKPR